MKPYGYKKTSKLQKKGDGCFYCTQHRKTTKSAVRKNAKEEIKETLVRQVVPKRRNRLSNG